MKKIISIAPGRTCLFGDHQDYLGLPIIACAISRNIKLTAIENDLRVFNINKPDINKKRVINIDDEIGNITKGDHLLYALKTLKRYGCIHNKGYTSTYNYRFVELILKNKENQKTFKTKIDSDPRYWFTDELQTIKLNIPWPETLPKGNYELYLNLPDPEPAIYNRPEYAIRLAEKINSKSIWNKTTGWNLLFPDIKVN